MRNGTPAEEPELDGGNYELLRGRLLAQAEALGDKADGLNARRTALFGGSELSIIGQARVRTANNCVPRDIVSVADRLLFGFNVSLHLRQETAVSDVFTLHELQETDDGFDFVEVGLDNIGDFLTDSRFVTDFRELYRYYKAAQLLQLRRDETKLLAVFQMGTSVRDVRVFQWNIDATGRPTYLDNRGERFHTYPRQHGFEWIQTGRESFVAGAHPHVSILDKVFVETVGGDLTVKVENNTASGLGVYAEPVDDPNQSLDDGQIQYVELGSLILLKILPFRESTWRYLVFNTRSQEAVRIDAIGQACVELPEDHGIIFPGGLYLQTGEYKVFDLDATDLELKRMIRSPNGEDVLYIFHRRVDGVYLLFPYNLVKKEILQPIRCHGYSLFDDGRLVILSGKSAPQRVHRVEIWKTSFMSEEAAEAVPTDGSHLSRVGNADLVRGISDALTLRQLIRDQAASRQTYEDIIAAAVRMTDAYYWLGHAEAGDLKATVREIKQTGERIIDEFEKVLAIKKRATDTLAEAEVDQRALIRRLRPQDWDRIEPFMVALTDLRARRGTLITLREVRYIDLASLDAMETEVVDGFDRVSQAAVDFLLGQDALAPLLSRIDELLGRIDEVTKTPELRPLTEELDAVNGGLDVLSEVVSTLEVEDPTQKTQILERISEVFGQVNRVRATLDNRRRDLQSKEGRAEFGAQFKLFSQSVSSALGVSDTPEACDAHLSRLMVQLEEIESRFGELDEFLTELASKREEVYEAFGAKRQTLLDQRQRRIENVATAADRILQGIGRRARGFTAEDALNTFFAGDAMVLKLKQLAEQLRGMGDTVKADEVEARVKGARQEALRGLRDRADLFEEGTDVIKLGRHRFNVNTQPFELTMVPRGDGMALHLTGTGFYQPIEDEAFQATRPFWSQTLVSETDEVYRGEYLATTLFFDAEMGRGELTLEGLLEATRSATGLEEVVRRRAAERYDEGYERGLHDADGAAILRRLLALQATAGLLRYPPSARAMACLFWAHYRPPAREGRSPGSPDARERWHRKARSLGRLSASLRHAEAEAELGEELGAAIAAFLPQLDIEAATGVTELAGRYLAEELKADHPRFTTSAEAVALRDALLAHLDREAARAAFEDDLRALEQNLADAWDLARAWLEAFVRRRPAQAARAPALLEAAALLLTERHLDREVSAAMTTAEVSGLLGRHPRIRDGKLSLRLDELLERLGRFALKRVPQYHEYRRLRRDLVERERARLRIDEFKPRIMSAFVRNKLINDVYLPLIGDNLAKQIGAVGAGKRTDLMGLLLLVSPPGYGKTTLMEYIANRLGLVFMKVNGPSLGHAVHSLDPAEAPNATARQEVEKINLAFEMSNNVMLYLDDIQHTHPELLQKFISLCDAQRRVEGVWRGRTRTYDMRGKKFCVVMAGNPYTESGEKFQIPDMLANRADTYNLGDILEGRGEAFALSYVENALTSNPVLAPLAARGQDDVYLLIRMAQGEPVAATDLSHGYSGAEIDEIVSVLQKLFAVRDVLLKVNQQYIDSASQDDAYRTEPPFKLQGSYRNMNKVAEKIVAAMNAQELESLIDDHYTAEAQTLTTGAEHNLLKLAELRGRMSDSQLARWSKIRREFRRVLSLGGQEDDPVTRVTSQLSVLGDRLDLIREAVQTAAERSDGAADDGDARELEAIDETRQQLEAMRLEADVRATQQNESQDRLAATLNALQAALKKLARPRFDVEVKTQPAAGLEALLSEVAELLKRDRQRR